MVSYCDKYVQIKLLRDSAFLNKAITYANKYFKEKYNLSSSILILDGGEKLKKDYLISWCYHFSRAEFDTEICDDNFLEEILKYSHLPLRIKLIKEHELLEQIKIKVQVLANSRVILILDKNNLVAQRYIKHVFSDCFLGSYGNEIYISSSTEGFWQKFVGFISDKIIHNIALKFEYNSFDKEEFLTQEEILIKNCYEVLESNFKDDFEVVKKRYLRLVKKYHPDKVHGENENIILEHMQKFRKVNEAYNRIKNYCILST